MCGIAGLVYSSPRLTDPVWVEETLKALSHRGPDAKGVALLAGGRLHSSRALPSGEDRARAVLLHRRLSILDLSQAGWQPMISPDQRFVIVFNGEIYNFLEIRKELESLGHRFHSRSDTEVLLASYAQWGPGCASRLVGMFAFALLDVERNRLFLARDPFGIKPFFVARWREGFAFSSEIQPLLQLPGVCRKVDPQRLYQYLRFGLADFGDGTMFADVRQLPPAHYLEISLDDASSSAPVRYWQIDLSGQSRLSFADSAERLRELFLESVRIHLRRDVPVGAALSGGIDSSSIVMAMRHLEPDLELHAFSFIAEDGSLSEERWVDLVVGASGAHVHKIDLRPSDLVADLDKLIRHQGEPFGSTSIYAQMGVFRRASEAGIKVMLDGQGADELLAGYSGYLSARLASLIRQGRLGKAAGFLKRGASPLGARRLLAQTGEYILPNGIQGLMRGLVGQELVPDWMDPGWFADHGVIFAAPTKRFKRESLRHALHETLGRSILPGLLRYEDRNSMAFSIESRVPFLNPRIAEFVFSLPEEYLIDENGTSKALFRAAMRGIVPDQILDRRDKLGFATPESRWLRELTPWVRKYLESDLARAIPALRHPRIIAKWQAVEAGQSPFQSDVWRWVNLIAWANLFKVEF